jgi:hypothetical protein
MKEEVASDRAIRKVIFEVLYIPLRGKNGVTEE